jgi:cytochrome c-type biogenesis protein
MLLFVYSLGLGVPFMLVGLGVGKLGAARFFSRNYHWFAGVSGTFLLAIGFLLITGLWVRLLSPVLNLVNRFTPPI